jgi:predicted nucleotide-binding protein
MEILIIEDDAFYAQHLSEMLTDRGVDARLVQNAEEALKASISSYEACIIDVMLPNDPSVSGISMTESRGGFMTGIVLARKFRKEKPDLKIVLVTSEVWNLEVDEWAAAQSIPLVKKFDGHRAVLEALQNLGVLTGQATPKSFIVHGHDEEALLQLKNYIQNALQWQEPIVLREKPNWGRTLIEKFEGYADRIDCVFVLLTPDDMAGKTETSETHRSRQNVIFELGYFLGQLGRNSGRIIVLYKGPQELPSDIQGVAWIAIDKSVEAAGEQIRREVSKLRAAK